MSCSMFVGCQWSLPRCAQEHANGRYRTEEACLSILDQLRKDTTGAGHLSGQYIREGLCDFPNLSAMHAYIGLPVL